MIKKEIAEILLNKFEDDCLNIYGDLDMTRSGLLEFFIDVITIIEVKQIIEIKLKE